MKKLMQVAGLALAALIMSPATALDVDLTPIPAAPGSIPPAPDHIIYSGEPIPGSQVYIESPGEPLFHAVKYVDHHEMHPCAVPKIIRVNDPCACRKKHCDCCEPQCVYIQICVPPCGCETVRCRKHGDRIRYDYGKWAVDVRVKKGFIVVDYQD